MHRRLIHRSYDCPLWLERLFVYLGTLVGMAGPYGMIGQHDIRDWAQRKPLCHPYLAHRSALLRDGYWQLHCELRLAHPPRLMLERRVAEDRFYRFLERTWMAQQLPPALALYALGGWAFVWWGVCARITAAVFGHWLIGHLAHNHGDVVREVHGAAVQGRNVRWTSLITMGESWHNNHHAYPGSARLGLQPGEWDPGWWVLVGLKRIGWAWDLKLPADLPHRPELMPPALPTTARRCVLCPATK